MSASPPALTQRPRTPTVSPPLHSGRRSTPASPIAFVAPTGCCRRVSVGWARVALAVEPLPSPERVEPPPMYLAEPFGETDLHRACHRCIDPGGERRWPRWFFGATGLVMTRTLPSGTATMQPLAGSQLIDERCRLRLAGRRRSARRPLVRAAAAACRRGDLLGRLPDGLLGHAGGRPARHRRDPPGPDGERRGRAGQ